MTALGLSLALFPCWLSVGYAVVSVLNSRRNALRNVLLAPAVGISSTVLPVFLLNRAGVSVSRSALPVLIILLALSVGLMWRTRPPIPWRRYAPFAAVLLAGLTLVGRPMLDFGFDWISYANDDMANYVLGANFFLENAYPNVPDATRLVSGSDYFFVVTAYSTAGIESPPSDEAKTVHNEATLYSLALSDGALTPAFTSASAHGSLRTSKPS